MHAQIGDWLVVPPGPHEHHVRRGRVEELVHRDGSPPYRVRWIDDDTVTVVFPPPDAHIEHHDDGATPVRTRSDRGAPAGPGRRDG